MRRTFLTAFVMLSSASVAGAARWTSPDGVIAFDLPDDGSLTVVPNPPAPAIAMWDAKDGRSRYLFLEKANPDDAPLEKSGLEEGILKSSNGKLLTSTESTIKGVPIFTIAVQGVADGQPIFGTQRVCTLGQKAYILVVASSTDPATQPTASAVLQSFAIILKPLPSFSLAVAKDPHRLSVTIGQVGVTILMVAGVFAFVRRRLRAPELYPPPDPDLPPAP